MPRRRLEVTDAASPAWQLTFIDFGMMGEVPDGLRRGLQQLMIAVAARDGKGLVDSIRDVGVLLPSADTAELERAMTQLFARFGGMGLAELQQVDQRELRDFATEFGDVVRALPFQLPENFLLIIRAMSLTSGMCSALDPEFNMWDAVEPYAAQLLRDERGNVVQALAKQALSIAGTVARLPQRLDALADRIEEGRLVANPAARAADGAARAHDPADHLGDPVRRPAHRRNPASRRRAGVGRRADRGVGDPAAARPVRRGVPRARAGVIGARSDPIEASALDLATRPGASLPP